MPIINEIFPNSLVKTVAFEIRFPNLFFLENRIGDFQVKVMKEFPESSLLLRRQIMFAEGPTEKSIEEAFAGADKETFSKVWQFKTARGVELNITSKTLSITTNQHKTYQHGNENRLRDLIASVCEKFCALTAIPLVTRVGLRYIDECPIPTKNNQSFIAYYNSTFPLERFPIETAQAMEFMTVVNREPHALRYLERLDASEGKPTSLTLDFDAFTENVAVEQILPTTDMLHDMISEEFLRTATPALLEFMRRPAEGV
jgi:uncharacterized protein (TIGR04255 family)